MAMNPRKIKVGVVGCGVVATAYYLPYLMRHAELVAVCDLVPERVAACQRLFGAREAYQDYEEMIRRADIEAVWILTAPGTHARFTVMAAEAGKHVLVQKPMATTLDDANAMVAAVRKNKVIGLAEPSQQSPLQPPYQVLRGLIERGALGAPYWFAAVGTGPSAYHPSLGGNPYGAGAFFTKDSGGWLFDHAYNPTEIATLLGSCKSVMGSSKISVPDRWIVPDEEYTRFLSQATDPDDANYWDVVVNLPKSQHVTMGAADNVFSVYEMANGFTGVWHVGRPFQPSLPGSDRGLFIMGAEGNLFMGGPQFAALWTTRKELLPSIDEDGWFRIPHAGDRSKAVWPKPVPGGFNYYHESSQHLIDCILEDRDPVVNLEFGRHVTEMMYGALESARAGRRYEMTTTLKGTIEHG